MSLTTDLLPTQTPNISYLSIQYTVESIRLNFELNGEMVCWLVDNEKIYMIVICVAIQHSAKHDTIMLKSNKTKTK